MPDYIPFGWFYLTNLLIGCIFLIGYGIRKKYPVAAWLTIVAALMTLFIAGIKLMGFPLHEWVSLITPATSDPVYSKFVPGGVLFFGIGLITVRWFMKFRTSFMDSMILILPWMMIIQRIGCFINGCCYGKPTVLPWAVSYPAGTSAFEHYAGTGGVHSGELVTCGLHPAQLYVVIGAVIAWLIIWKSRQVWKSPGSRAIFGMLMLGTVRFAVEFFRETPIIKWYSQSFIGINILQWIILLMALVLTAILIRNEKSSNPARKEVPLQENLPRTMGILFFTIFLIWNLRRLFEFQELLLVQILVTVALAASVYGMFLSVALSRFRLWLTLLLLIAFTTMSQDIIKAESDSIRKDSVKTWFNFSLAGSEGRYEHRIRNCSGDITSRELMNQATGGIDFSYHYQPNARHQLDFGTRAWISDINNVTNRRDSGFLSYGINPYVNYNHRFIGLGLGVNYLRDFDFYPTTAFYPSVYLRLGPQDIFFVDAGVMDQLQFNGLLSFFHVGLGSGFRTKGKSVWRTGVSISGFDNSFDDLANFYLMGDFRINDRLVLRPGLYLGNKSFGMLGISYNFGLREKPRMNH